MNDDYVDEHWDDIEAEAGEQIEEVKVFQPREYQLQILSQARNQNCIAFLDTGTGKTYIAIMLLLETQGKAVFLAPTRALVLQQGLVAQRFNVNAGIFQGHKYDSIGRLRWKRKLDQHSAFFFTPQLFLNVLRYGFLRIEDFGLIIFDECHWCFGQHPYNNILREFIDPMECKPKIFGMTASPVTSKITSNTSLIDKISELASNLYCSYAPVDRSSVEQVANKPQVQVERFCEAQSPFDLESEIISPLRDCGEHEEVEEVELVIRRNAGQIYGLLGGFALSMYLKDLGQRVSLGRLQNTLGRIADGFDREIFKSSRVKRLLAVLTKHFSGLKARQMKAIIFTERRITAYYLNQILRTDAEFVEKGYVSDVVVGLNSDRGKFDIARMKDAQQEKVIARFRDEEINVLVATSVAEEGLDIPSCDLVIRFESFSSNLRSYVQSRGRARQLNSKFYLLLEQRDDSMDLQKIEDFNQAIEFMKTLADLGTPMLAPHFEPMENYTVKQTGARVSLNWSCQYLLEVCASLPTAPFTDKKEPKYASEFFPRNACPFQVANPSHGGYLGIIRLPRELKEIEEFADSLQPTVNDAKAAAALKAIAKLHALQLLNDNLRPSWMAKREIEPPTIPKNEIKMVDILGEDSLPRIKIGKQSVAALPQDQTIYLITLRPGQTLSLYVLDIKPDFPEFVRKGLAILCPEEMQLSGFRAYPGNIYKNYDYSVCPHHPQTDCYPPSSCTACITSSHWVVPELVAQREFQEAELSLFKAFHSYLFASIMQEIPELVRAIQSGEIFIGSALEQNGGDLAAPLMVVPWDFSSREIDYNLIYNVSTCLKSNVQNEIWKPVSSFLPSLGFSGYIVQSLATSALFYTVGRGDSGISTLIPAKGSSPTTVQEYYFSKHMLLLQPQEVLQVKPLGKFKNAFWPISSNARRAKDPILLPESLLSVYPVPLGIVNMGRIMPVVYTNLQRQYVYLKLERDFHISSRMLQQALTCTAANEAYDYQRLETLGDTVLKFRVTKFFFLSNPEAHEGIISQERENCTCNKALYSVAMKRKLYLYMQVAPVTLRTWVPPGVNLHGKMDVDEDGSDDEDKKDSPRVTGLEELIDLKREEDVVELDFSENKADISNKQLADVVEALIGAAYLEGKFQSAERLIRDLEILPDGKRRATPLPQSRDFSSLEQRLGIRFRTQGWYTEAFLHGSAGAQRDYQRLECLGDALIDLIAMEHLFTKYPLASPGTLSKLKSAAVNNRVQAFISVKLGLLSYLDYNNAELSLVLKQFELAVKGLISRRSMDIHTLPEQGLKVSADVFEALFGAILLDYDYDTAKAVFFAVAGDIMEAVATPETVRTNPHTQFFEWAQKNRLTGVKIKRSLEKTPAGLDQYTVEVSFQGRLMGRATARSKLEASENACNEAMRKIETEWRKIKLKGHI